MNSEPMLPTTVAPESLCLTLEQIGRGKALVWFTDSLDQYAGVNQKWTAVAL